MRGTRQLNVIITGGLGFLGRMLAERLLKRGYLTVEGDTCKINSLSIIDSKANQSFMTEGIGIIHGDFRDAKLLHALLQNGYTSVFHLASMLSAAAEEDWHSAVACNVGGLITIIRSCNNLCYKPRVVFTSSIAAVARGNAQHDPPLAPVGTYGVTKAVSELLLESATKAGLVDARIARLPTVIVRPGAANRAASGFASAIFRETLRGRTAIVPVPPTFRLLVVGAATAVDNLIALHEVSQERLGDSRVIQLCGLSVTVEQMLNTLRDFGGGKELQNIQFQHDPLVERVMSTWPVHWNESRANMLGLPRDNNLHDIVRQYVDSL